MYSKKRKKEKRIILTIIFSLCLGFPALAQDTTVRVWTLEQCIKQAVENNIQIKQSELDVEISQGDLKQSRAEFLPDLNAYASQEYASGKSNTDFVNSSNSTYFSLSSQYDIFKGFQRNAMVSYNKINLDSKLKLVEKAKNDITLNIATYYLQVLYYKELIKTSQIQVELSKLQVERIEKLVKSGSEPEGKLSEMQSQLAQDQMILVDAENNLSTAKLNLTQLLELNDPKGFDVVEPTNLLVTIDSISQVDVSQVFADAQSFLPEIKNASLQTEASKQMLAYQKGAYLPTLSLKGTIYSGYTDVYDMGFSDQINNNFKKTLSLTLSIPIFSRFSTQTTVSRARINVVKSENELELARKVVYKDIQLAQNNSFSALKKYEATTVALTAYQDAFRYAKQKFEAGSLSTFDYNTAKSKLAKVESELLQAKYDYLFRSKILDFYRGRPITLN